MRTKKWSLWLAAVMVLSLVVCPASAGAEVTEPEPEGEVFIQDDFSGSLDPRLELFLTDQGTLDIQNEKLALTRKYTDATGAKNFDGFRYHFKEDKTGIAQGVIGMEVTVEKEVENQEIWIKWQDVDKRDAVAVCWTGTGLISSYMGSANTNVKSGVTGTGPKTFKVLLNVDQKTYSLWMDGEKLVTNWALRYAPRAGGISMFYAYLQKANAYTAYFDNMNVYESAVPGQEKTLYDQTWLTQALLTAEDASAVTQNLTLPETGQYGSSITWESSAETVIAADGTVRQAELDTTVTMTAHISAGGKNAEKEFTFTVPGRGSLAVTEPAPDGDYIVNDSFDGGLDPRIETVLTDKGTLNIQDEKLALTRVYTDTAKPNNFDGFRYWFQEDKSGYFDEVTGLEFTLEKSVGGTEVWAKVQDKDNRDAVAIWWSTNGKIYLYNGTAGKVLKSDMTGTGPVRFKLLMNPKQNTFSLWMDGEKKAENWAFRYAPRADGIKQFYVYLQNANAYTAYIDDFKFYKSLIPEREKTLYDQAWLTQELLTGEDPVTQNLSLPETGQYGSGITWESSAADVITNDGVVHTPSGPDVTVTMTATIAAGGSSVQKSFELTVKGSGETIDAPAPAGGLIVDDGFGSAVLDPRIEPVLSAGGSLAAENGRLALSRTLTDGTADAFRYWFNEDKSGYQDEVVALEYTLEKQVANQEVWMKIQDADKRDAVAVCWTGSGQISSYMGSGNKTVKTGVTGTGPLKFQILLNTKQNTYSLWAGGEKLVTNWGYRYLPHAGGLAFFYAYLQKTNSYTAYFDDFKFYESVIPFEERTLYDKTWLTLEQLTGQPADGITENLLLPETGRYGSEISWNSSVPSVISDAGQVTLPKENTNVTLSAAIASGRYSQETAFDLVVAAGNVLDVPIPKDGYIVQDPFDTETMDARIEKYGADGTLRQTGGRLAVTRTSTAQDTSDGFRYYFNQDHSGYQGSVLAIEFTLEKSAADKEVLFRVRSASDKDYVAATWMADGRVTSFIGGTNQYVKSGLTDKGPHKFTILINTDYNTYSMWIDQERVVENGETRASDADGPAQLLSWVQRANAYTYYMDDFAVYDPEIPDLEKLLYDERWLTDDKLTFQPLSAVTMDLPLPETGNYGSSIEWRSSAAETIANDGTVTRPQDAAKEVELKAKLKSGTKTKEKTFSVNVLKKAPKGEVPQADGAPVFAGVGEEGMVQSFYFSPSKMPFSGEYALAFTLENPDLTSSSTVQLMSGEKSAVALKFEAGKLLLHTRASQQQDAQWQTFVTGLNPAEPQQVHLLISTRSNQCSVWINGEKAADAVLTAEQVSSVDHMAVQALSAVRTRDIQFYRAILPDIDKILFDDGYLTWEHLTWQDASRVFENLPLPATGAFGSSIRWQSSAPETVAADGTVTRPAAGSKNVRLSAVMATGAETKEKIFDISVTALKDDELPEIIEPLMEDDCSGLEPAPGWSFVPDGGRIEQRFGAVELTRYRNEGQTVATRYLMEDQSEVTGIIGMEFTLRKSAAKDLQLRVASGYDYFALNWTNAGVIRVNYNTSADSAEAWYNVTTVEGLSAKFNLLFNTEDGTYSLWVNNQLQLHHVYARGKKARGVQLIKTWLESGNFCTVSIDNIKLYRSYLTRADRVAADEAWLTLDKLRTKEPDALTPDSVDSNLNLMTKGIYGSDITWTSSDSSLVEADGTLHRPGAGALQDPAVTLTAHISAGGEERTKDIRFYVKRELTEPQDQIKADMELLTLERISPEGSTNVKMSLNFVGHGPYGSDISWSSSDPAVITSSGRVIRPQAGSGDRDVTVSARLSNGGMQQEKSFSFTVCADEVFVDPQYMTDEAFFGVWDAQSGQWSSEGELDYSFNARMQAVGEAVQAGDYALAKQKLLDYMRDKENKYSIGLDKRDTNWVNMIVDDFYHLRGSEFYEGEFVAGNDWNTVKAAVKPEEVTRGATGTYALTAWYNEASALRVRSQNSADPAQRPQMKVKVNNKVRSYEAVDDVTIRAGAYKDVNYGGEESLTVKTYGDFLSGETYKAMLLFDFSDIKENDSVTEAWLELSCKAEPAFAGEKRIMVQQEPTTLWAEEDAVWNTFPGYIYSFNGLPGKNDWKSPENADVEYLYQMVRFSAWESIALEYKITSDETYAYKALRIMEDFIQDTGNWQTSSAPVMRGGYTRSLDSAIRLINWVRSYDILVDSKSMTPEINTALLKGIYDMTDCLKYHHASSGNWVQTEHMNMLHTALLFPEFKDAKTGTGNWMQTATELLEPLIYQNILEDGSYVEATGGYNVGAYGSFRGFKSIMKENGVEVSDAYNERLHKGAYYNALLFAPDGTSIQYGDETYSKWTPHYKDIAQWYGDKELLYIDTLGAEGTPPSWTSKQFPESKITAMRSDWGKKALYMFTNVRGGGQHGHADANHVTVAAYGRILLNDGGIFTYTATDPYRVWGTSSTGHNTVVINGENQRMGSNTGTVEEWQPGAAFNYLSQTTTATQGFSHNRKITFIKPYFWIVSDRVTPEAGYTANEYKQNWHMLPGANPTVDNEKNILRSNYDSGANIIVASADEDALAKEEQGWYDKSYGEVVPAKYGYFQKENVTGTASFDTVLVPTDNDPNAQVEVKRLPAAENATALEIRLKLSNSDKTGLFYQAQTAVKAQFGPYETDAQMAYVEKDSAGNLKTLVLQSGTYLRETATGKDLIRLSQSSVVSVEKIGTKIVVGTIEGAPLPETAIIQSGTVRKMECNGADISFGSENGYLIPYGKGGATDVDQGGNQGQIVPPGGGSGGGGGGSDQPRPTPTQQATPAPTATPSPVMTPTAGPGQTQEFADISGHWAAEDIQVLAQQGVVKGGADGLFHPDDTMTRAEFLALVQRASGGAETAYHGPFGDVGQEEWYAGAVQFGLDSGLIAPAEQFRPDDLITRAEMAKILSQACLTAGKSVPEDYRAGYPDVNRSGWSAPYIDAADYLNLIRGMETGLFAPEENATRAQGAVMIRRFIDLMGS